jgi:hypothetical protein
MQRNPIVEMEKATKFSEIIGASDVSFGSSGEVHCLLERMGPETTLIRILSCD